MTLSLIGICTVGFKMVRQKYLKDVQISPDMRLKSGEKKTGYSKFFSVLTTAALLWSRRRDELDRQEAELLKRVQGVREKVVDHMTRQHRSHDRRTTATTD